MSDQSKLLVPASFIAFFPADFPQRAWWNLKFEFLSDLMNWENTFTQIELSTVTGRLFHAYTSRAECVWDSQCEGLITNDWPIRSWYHAGLIRGKLELSWRLLRSDCYNIWMSLAEAELRADGLASLEWPIKWRLVWQSPLAGAEPAEFFVTPSRAYSWQLNFCAIARLGQPAALCHCRLCRVCRAWGCCVPVWLDRGQWVKKSALLVWNLD